jgi:hypothetical protein
MCTSSSSLSGQTPSAMTGTFLIPHCSRRESKSARSGSIPAGCASSVLRRLRIAELTSLMSWRHPARSIGCACSRPVLGPARVAPAGCAGVLSSPGSLGQARERPRRPHSSHQPPGADHTEPCRSYYRRAWITWAAATWHPSTTATLTVKGADASLSRSTCRLTLDREPPRPRYLAGAGQATERACRAPPTRGPACKVSQPETAPNTVKTALTANCPNVAESERLYGTGPGELPAVLVAEQRYLVEQEGRRSVRGSTYVD